MGGHEPVNGGPGGRAPGGQLRERANADALAGETSGIMPSCAWIQTTCPAAPLAGCGMGKRELSEWAVMNLSMEDRGAAPQEADCAHGPTQRNGPDRFLSGNLSYFGVRPPGWLARAGCACPGCMSLSAPFGWGSGAWQVVTRFFLALCLQVLGQHQGKSGAQSMTWIWKALGLYHVWLGITCQGCSTQQPSCMQVGSKNAAFFMGRCIKVATRRAGDAFVHELTIGAEELEQRYREHKAGRPCTTPAPGA